MIATRPASETRPAEGPLIDVSFTREFARVHEEAGFDRVLIGYFSDAPDGFMVASATSAAHTERLGVLLAHRPGFVAPTLAARKLATLDQFSGGGSPSTSSPAAATTTSARDGDFLDKAPATAAPTSTSTSCARTGRRRSRSTTTASSTASRAFSRAVRCAQLPHLPIYFGGSSDAAIAVSARHADVYALWGEPLADAARPHRPRCRAAAAAYGRNAAAFSLSTRPILGADRREAPGSALTRILDQAREPRPPRGDSRPPRAGERRARSACSAAAAKGDVHDRCLFTPLAAATGARGNSTALVGSVEHGGRGAARLLRHRRHHLPHPRLRPAGGRARLRGDHPARARRRVCHCVAQGRSKTAAKPWPPPMHIETSPQWASVRSSSCISLTVRIAPVAPTG